MVYSEDFSSIDMKSIGSSNEKLPAIGVGTKGIQDFKVAEEALSYAFNLGLKLVEVSDSYGEGLAQELVGRVIKKFKRDEIFVVLRIDSIKFSDAESAVKAVSNSLHRMGVSYVDVVISAGLNEIAGLSMQIKIFRSVDRQGSNKVYWARRP
uniref:NADP-dependent oxidoreductase domain-containing protein n=1 Tax=Ignisphaera aggregans TaxID=334771 RepID=A0A7C2V946_9CREN